MLMSVCLIRKFFTLHTQMHMTMINGGEFFEDLPRTCSQCNAHNSAVHSTLKISWSLSAWIKFSTACVCLSCPWRLQSRMNQFQFVFEPLWLRSYVPPVTKYLWEHTVYLCVSHAVEKSRTANTKKTKTNYSKIINNVCNLSRRVAAHTKFKIYKFKKEKEE